MMGPNLSAVSSIVSIIQGIVTILALVAGTYIAWIGLSTWKEQLTAKSDSELARRVLLDVYKVRNVIRRVRGAGFHVKVSDRYMKEIHDAFQGELEKELSSLDLDIVEAEAMWGEDAKMFLTSLDVIGNQVKSAIDIFHSTTMREGEIRARIFRILFRDKEYPDEFDLELDQAVTRLEKLLRPKLRLRKENRKIPWD